MQKIICFILVLIASITSVYAETIDKTLTKMGINKGAVSVMIKNVQTGDTVYALNETTPMHPASTLKLITSSAAVDTLGADYVFKTQLYKSVNNDLYLKLSGDPLLKSQDLEKLIQAAKNKKIVPKSIYIDDSVFDKNEWGEGWQWDDELNPLMPKFSAYNLNKNLLGFEISPTTNGSPAVIVKHSNYPLTFMNYTKTTLNGGSNVGVAKNEDIPNILNIVGNVSKKMTVTVPIKNPKLNFILSLEEVIKNVRFEYYSKITSAKLPEKNVYLVDEIEHGLDKILPLIIKNSDNLSAETLFKAAGAVYAKSQGTFENSKQMLDAYFEKLNINSDDIKIVDGSGVSKNNLMTAEFMTDFLVGKTSEENFETFKTLLPTPSEGTLKNRMLYFKDNLYAKTGTLAETSAIAGYITSKRGRFYAFDIMINDAKTSSADKKNIEEQILRTLYVNY